MSTVTSKTRPSPTQCYGYPAESFFRWGFVKMLTTCAPPESKPSSLTSPPRICILFASSSWPWPPATGSLTSSSKPFPASGSGCGLFTALAAQLVGPTGLAHGIDLRPEIIAFGRRNVTIQKRRADAVRRQREAHRQCPRTGLLVPGSVFVGTCAEQEGRMRYPAKLAIDAREGSTIEARFYWQTFGKTLTRLEGTITLPEDDGMAKMELREVQVMSTALDHVTWLPCWYAFTLDPRAGRLTGTFGTCKTLGGGSTSLSMTHLMVPEDDLCFNNLEFFERNCFHFRPPLSTVVQEHGGYDRIHCGAACRIDHLPRLTRLLARGGVLVVPVGGSMTKVTKDLSTGAVTSTDVLQVNYGDLEVPSDLDTEEQCVSGPEGTMYVLSAADDEGRTRKRKYEGEGTAPDGSGTGVEATASDGHTMDADDQTAPATESQTGAVSHPVAGSDEPKAAAGAMGAEFVYFSKCCRKGLARAGDEVPEDDVDGTLGGPLELQDGEAVLFRKAENLKPDDFQYVSDVLQGRVCNMLCTECGIPLGIRFIGEPPERGDDETYDGCIVIPKAYMAHPQTINDANSSECDDEPVRCTNCSEQLSSSRQVLGTQHQWTLETGPSDSRPERAAYINWLNPAAITLGDVKQARLTQGSAKYTAVFCKKCGEEVGWKFLEHLYPHERIKLSWYCGRYGLVISRVKGIQVEHPLSLSLTQLMRHLELAGLFQHGALRQVLNEDTDGPNAGLHQATFTITGFAADDDASDNEIGDSGDMDMEPNDSP